ncbi:hypothetical protein CCR75_004695 [Bremia lactucae]|uniref:Uncharacterized protein n=1 Tax=Bremia lactucae TaxID=4779 RepID=A0A976IHV7_BRELC|nr:hypothetical protein CCR75_004695 [Bremia lactucae]
MKANRRALNVRELLELERQIYQESIDRVLQQQEKLSAGDLDEFVRHCKPFETDRAREVEVAQKQLQFSQQDALSLLEFDLQQAEDEYQEELKKLKCRLLNETRRRRARVEKRLKALDEMPTKRNVEDHAVNDFTMLKGKNLSPKFLEMQLTRSRKQTMRTFNFKHLSNGVLPTPTRIVTDVMNEREKLQKCRARDKEMKLASKECKDSSKHVAVDEDGQKLRLGKKDGDLIHETIGIGEAVILKSQLSEQDFYGYVSAITRGEVKLRLVCGSHARVAIDRLRTGQCTLHKQPQNINLINKPLGDCNEK